MFHSSPDPTRAVRSASSATPSWLACGYRLLTPGSGSAPRSITLFDDLDYFNEVLPALSPDGRWLAYQSNRSADAEVYLRPVPRRVIAQAPGLGGGWLCAVMVTRRPGDLLPQRDRHDGRENTNVANPRGRETGRAVRPERLRPAGDPGRQIRGRAGRPFPVAKDSGSGHLQDRVVLVQNWTEDVKRLVPTD